MKTPENYFIENVELPADTRGGPLSSAEQAFIDKYVGIGGESLLANTPLVDPRGDAVLPGLSRSGRPGAADQGTGEDFEALVREQEEVRLVSFLVGGRECALPIMAIQEVIKYVPVTKLPAAPDFIAGIINLRGRVTPLIRLRALMRLAGDAGDDRFIVVCRHKGLQVGLMIQAVSTMYKARHEEVDWNVTAQFGEDATHLLGLLKVGDKLVSILSIDRLTEDVLRKEGGGHA